MAEVGYLLAVDESAIVRPRRVSAHSTGVVIYMYLNERDHPVAHFHAYHDGRRASVSAKGSCASLAAA